MHLNLWGYKGHGKGLLGLSSNGKEQGHVFEKNSFQGGRQKTSLRILHLRGVHHDSPPCKFIRRAPTLSHSLTRGGRTILHIINTQDVVEIIFVRFTRV